MLADKFIELTFLKSALQCGYDSECKQTVTAVVFRMFAEDEDEDEGGTVHTQDFNISYMSCTEHSKPAYGGLEAN